MLKASKFASLIIHHPSKYTFLLLDTNIMLKLWWLPTYSTRLSYQSNSNCCTLKDAIFIGIGILAVMQFDILLAKLIEFLVSYE